MPQLLKTLAKHPTESVFGVDGEGNPYSAVLAAGPHWIVAGETGSGKSVYLNNMLMSMLIHCLPSEVKLTWIDPKKVEATKYKGLPYCPIDPITDMSDASAMLSYLVWLMDDRYADLERTGVKKIDDFNEKIESDPEGMAEMGFTEKMSFWVLVIDEYADMVMQNKNVEGDLVRLGQKARASGIHVVIATQRPSADILTPTLKANIPSRIGLKTTDYSNSNIILGESGCEALRGYGDSLVRFGSEGIVRVQGPFLSDGELDAIREDMIARYGESERFDFKTKVMELMPDKYNWADEYTDDVPMEKRHLVLNKRSRLGF